MRIKDNVLGGVRPIPLWVSFLKFCFLLKEKLLHGDRFYVRVINVLELKKVEYKTVNYSLNSTFLKKTQRCEGYGGI